MATTQTNRLLEDLVVAWSVHDVEKIASLCTDDCVYEDVTMGVVNRGKAELKAFANSILAALPDFTMHVPFVPRVLMSLLLRDIYLDKAAGEEILRRSGLDWTLVYPVTLTNGPRAGRYRTGERLVLSGFPRISRADVADFLLKQIEDKTYLRKGVLVSAGWHP